LEQTLVEGENYDAYVSRPSIAPLQSYLELSEGVLQPSRKYSLADDACYPLFRRSFTYVEEMIQRQEQIESVLRLLILLSVTNNGLPKKHFDYLR